jgi:hypothetical protein
MLFEENCTPVLSCQSEKCKRFCLFGVRNPSRELNYLSKETVTQSGVHGGKGVGVKLPYKRLELFFNQVQILNGRISDQSQNSIALLQSNFDNRTSSVIEKSI